MNSIRSLPWSTITAGPWPEHSSFQPMIVIKMQSCIARGIFGSHHTPAVTAHPHTPSVHRFIRIITEIFNSVVFLFAGTEAARFQGESPMSTRHDFLIFLSLLIFRWAKTLTAISACCHFHSIIADVISILIISWFANIFRISTQALTHWQNTHVQN